VRLMESTNRSSHAMDPKETTRPMSHKRKAVRTLAAALALAGLLLATAALPSQAEAAVSWQAETSWGPTVLQPGGKGGVKIEVGNSGDQTATGWPTVAVALPPGVTLAQANPTGAPLFNWKCTAAGDPQVVTCNNPIIPSAFWPKARTYIRLGLVAQHLSFTVDVAAGAPLGSHPLAVTLSGAGATTPTTSVKNVRIGDQPAGFGLVEDSFNVDALDHSGMDYTQAGGHPHDFVTEFEVNKSFQDPAVTGNWLLVVPDDIAKDVVTDLPAGFLGNPQIVPTCPKALVDDYACPHGAQVGVVEFEQHAASGFQMTGVYNVVPDKDTPAQFMFDTGGGQGAGPVLLTPVLRSDGDWSLSVHAKNLPEATPLYRTRVTFWGDPANPRNDALRCPIPSHVGDVCAGYASSGSPTALPSGGSVDQHMPHGSPLSRRPFLTLPTRCTGATEITSIHLSPWPAPGSFEADGDPDLAPPTTWFTAVAPTPALTGCEKLSFFPEIDVRPTVSKPGVAAGLEFELSIPQNDDPDGLATAHLRNATVTLPLGTTVNSGSADGLAACSSGQIGLVSKSPVRFTKLEPSCPLASKVGTVVVDTPLLAEPLNGDVFLAAQGDNPFDSLVAMYVVVRGPGILGKLAGHVELDPDTGAIKTTVIDNPQVPFETLTVRLKSGDRAPLTLPSSCGEHTTTADFTSWAGHDVEVSDGFTVDCPGNAGVFDPSFAAGTANPAAAGSSPLRTRIVRGGGKELGRVTMDLPRGLLASPKHVEVCGEAQLQSGASKTGRELQGSPSCPVGSQIGTTTVGVGSGSSPFFPLMPGTAATGRVFLTGAHHAADRAAPAGMRQIAYGVAIEVPAVAGPFDLGRVLVRAAIYADPATADLSVVSDKLPRILQGVPLDARDVRVDVDRPGFSRNPTSCAQKQFDAWIEAQDGTVAQRSSRFQVGDCAALPFRPRLALRLTGKRQRTTGRHPGVRATVRQTGLGEAGIEKAVARLPKSLALDPDNAQSLCEFADGTRPDLENHCPKGSIVGRARAFSPLLKQPLAGNVYFVKNVRRDARTGNEIRTLPMIVVALRGEIAVNLRGASSTTRGGRLVNTFASVPDAPITRFNLNIKGGSDGILTVTRTRASRINLCRAPRSHVADVDMNGHNGKRRDFSVRVKTPCAKKKKAATKRRR